MVSSPKKCILCDKNGAFSFNRLCSFHWDKLIDRNIKKFVAEEKKKGSL